MPNVNALSLVTLVTSALVILVVLLGVHTNVVSLPVAEAVLCAVGVGLVAASKPSRSERLTLLRSTLDGLEPQSLN